MQPQTNQIHRFNTSYATLYGIEEAILISHFAFWIMHNLKLNINNINGRTWTYQTREQIASCFSYLSAPQVRRITDSLVRQGVLLKGNFNKDKRDKTIWYAFADEAKFLADFFNDCIDETNGNSDDSSKALPDPKIPDTLKAMPNSFSKKKGGAFSSRIKKEKKKPDKSKQRLYPRSAEKQQVFEWLKTLGLNADENTLSYWAHKYDKKTLEKTYCHYNYKTKTQGFTPLNPVGFFIHLLKNEHSPIDDVTILNKDFAKNFAHKNNWVTLQIKEKYIIDITESNSTFDLSLNMPHGEFVNSLNRFYKLIRGT